MLRWRGRQDSAVERLINAAEKQDRNAFRVYSVQWGWKGIDFPVGAISVVWQDGALLARQAFMITALASQ